MILGGWAFLMSEVPLYPSTLHLVYSSAEEADAVAVIPSPSTLVPQSSTLNPQPSTLNSKLQTLNPKPYTLNLYSQTLSPKP